MRQAQINEFAAQKQAAGTEDPGTNPGTTPAQKAPGSSSHGGIIGSPEWASTGAFSGRGKTLGGVGLASTAKKPGPDPYDFDLADEPVAARGVPGAGATTLRRETREVDIPGDEEVTGQGAPGRGRGWWVG